MHRLAVIPARWASTRFPGKPLTLLHGTPMVQHVYRRCQEARCFDSIIVATDDERVAESVRGFGGTAQLTSAQCASGTDRCAEVVSTLSRVEVVVNVQGDEPALPPDDLRRLALHFDAGRVQMATLVRPLQQAERQHPNVVKVVRADDGRALYFSRADIPFERVSSPVARWAHVGLYGYRREVLLRLSRLPVSDLELTESLEQLRALGAGIPIDCLETEHPSAGVDSPQDVPAAEAALLRMKR